MIPRHLVYALLLACPLVAQAQSLGPAFLPNAARGEQEAWFRWHENVRVYVNAPAELGEKHRVLVIYATPNGNSLEQTWGCAAGMGPDWRYDIQHVGAQIRRFRALDPSQAVIVAVAQPASASWPAFRRQQPDANQVIRTRVAELQQLVGADEVVLTGHSGGGAFLFGFLDGEDTIPATVSRIAFLDANYSFDSTSSHGAKLLAWLRGDDRRKLTVLAYDDREIKLNGQFVVGPTGGTYRATQRMVAWFRNDLSIAEQAVGDFQHFEGMGGQFQCFVHRNPTTKILHTALVGDMNGVLQVLTLGTPFARTWGQFGGPRAYEQFIAAVPLREPLSGRASLATEVSPVTLGLPPRAQDAPVGSEFRRQIESLSRADRERVTVQQILKGNIPSFLRRLIPIRVQQADSASATRSAVYFVTGDYLAVGSDDDFFRVPLSPGSALSVAAATGCTLLTTKISDDLQAAATVRLEPRPLVQDRDSVATFYQHHQLVESQLRGRPRDSLVVGLKKDIVFSNRLQERPHRVAIYGWHYPDGRPIQPLYIGHVDWYVDYSHGVRLLGSQLLLDGSWRSVADVLRDPRLSGLLSSEGPLDPAALQQASGWQTLPLEPSR